ncbi:MAG: hypothetical protein JNM76_12650 [Betaproteobacteria bacterium]|nr:hypothetical protein [Betaproteobacteria bacterium]
MLSKPHLSSRRLFGRLSIRLAAMLGAFAVSLALQWPLLAHAQSSAKAGFAIERIDSRLYFHGTGKFSKVLDAKTPLHNTIIGEGGAGAPSVATFVTVVVTGSALENAMSHVLLEVTDVDGNKRKPVLKQRAPVGFLNDSQKQSQVGFWLYDTGCGNLEISARLGNERFKEPRGLHPAEYGKPVTQMLNFRCGE